MLTRYLLSVIHHQLLGRWVFHGFKAHSVHCLSRYPLGNVMAGSRCTRFTEIAHPVLPPLNIPPPPVEKHLKNPPPNYLFHCDYRLLSPINRNNRHNPTPGLQIKCQDRMSLHQPDNQLTGSLNNPTRNVDQ